MTYHRLNGRLAKLEQQTTVTGDYTRMPAAQRRAQIHALLLQAGVASEEVESTHKCLLALTPAERAAWIRERRA